MSQESEAIKKTLVTGAKVGAIVILALAAFFGAFAGLTTLFDSMGFKPGASGMTAMAVIWCIIAVGGALKWKYDQILREIKKRDENIMRGLRG